MSPRSFLAVLLSLTLLITHAESAPKAKPVDAPAANASSPAPRVAAPAFVNTITFNVESDGDHRTLVVTYAPGLIRIDIPTDRMSVIYDPNAEHYTGLEHSNYTWWEFTWPEVRDAVEGSTRYATRLRDLGPELLEENNDSSAPSTNATVAGTDPNVTSTSTSPTAGGDTSGYVWHPTKEQKRIAGFDCTHWIGETVGGEQIDAWCAAGVRDPVSRAISILRAVNEPMALVPVRNLMPPLAFVAWDALTKGGVTPVLMTWGSDDEKNRFALVSARQHDGKLSYFEVPKLYVKTTLVTMDGIGNQKPAGAPRSHVDTPALIPDPVLPMH